MPIGGVVLRLLKCVAYPEPSPPSDYFLGWECVRPFPKPLVTNDIGPADLEYSYKATVHKGLYLLNGQLCCSTGLGFLQQHWLHMCVNGDETDRSLERQVFLSCIKAAVSLLIHVFCATLLINDTAQPRLLTTSLLSIAVAPAIGAIKANLSSFVIRHYSMCQAIHPHRTPYTETV